MRLFLLHETGNIVENLIFDFYFVGKTHKIFSRLGAPLLNKRLMSFLYQKKLRKEEGTLGLLHYLGCDF